MRLRPLIVTCALVLLAAAAMPSAAAAQSDEFASQKLDTTLWIPRTPLEGSRVLSGRVDDLGLDGRVARLVYPANTESWRWGPRWATQIHSRPAALYGSYSARMRSGRAAVGEGVISGFFTYFNDGVDWNGDGMIDNHEIDFEFANTERAVVYLSVWTNYDDTGDEERFVRTAARINLRNGRIWTTPVGGEGGWDLVRGPDIPFTDPTFDHGARYYTYGFEWEPDSVTFWIDLEDGEGPRTLWQVTGEPGVTIPSIASPTFFNVWRTYVNWWTRAHAPPPSRNVLFRIDHVEGP